MIVVHWGERVPRKPKQLDLHKNPWYSNGSSEMSRQKLEKEILNSEPRVSHQAPLTVLSVLRVGVLPDTNVFPGFSPEIADSCHVLCIGFPIGSTRDVYTKG